MVTPHRADTDYPCPDPFHARIIFANAGCE
jgi:hypothetical protein